VNKPITQLELMPAAIVPAIDTTDTTDTKVAAEEIVTKAIADALAQAGPDEFDWTTEDSVVVNPRPGVAIYENRAGDVVIRTQNPEDGPQGDHFAYVSPEGLPAVLKALKAYLP
jgi:hypothetical protein